MGRKAKRIKRLRRIERLKKASVLEDSPVENSVMQEKLKAAIPASEEPKPDIVDEMIEEVKELVEEVSKPEKVLKAKKVSPPRRRRSYKRKQKN